MSAAIFGAQVSEPASAQNANTPSADATGNADDIVVTARRGDAAFPAERELDESEIGLFGANSIAELIKALEPLIGNPDTAPVLLVNGKRDDGISGVAGFPPEALARLAILPPEAAARYGYPSGRRVINLVLKPKFSSWQVTSGATLPTAGGRDSERSSIGRVVIKGSTIWNAQLQWSRDSALLRSRRRLPAIGGPLSLDGYVRSTGDEGLDPYLDSLAGRTVVLAGLPVGARSGPPTIEDFAASDDPPMIDANAYRTLLPSSHSIAFNTGLTHPVGSYSGSINLVASSTGNLELLGLPSISLRLPAGSPWSPFARDVELVPPLYSASPLRNTQHTRSVSISTAISGSTDGWRTSFAASYLHSWTIVHVDRDPDISAAQDLINAGSPDFNPYAIPPLQPSRDSFRSGLEVVSARASAGRTLVTLPAGDVSMDVSLNAAANRSANIQVSGSTGMIQRLTLTRRQMDVLLSLTLPLTSRGKGVLPALGDMSIDLSIGASALSDARPQRQITIGANWMPVPVVRLNGSIAASKTGPTVDQLNGPHMETTSRIYDPLLQEIAQVTLVTGGNPTLGSGRRVDYSLRGYLGPLIDRTTALTVEYRRQLARGGLGGLPTLTPLVEVAFPDRFKRNADGHLILVDGRPISIARDDSSQLSTGLTLTLSGGSKPLATTGSALPLRQRRLSLAINHSWQLSSLLDIRKGLPVLDRLDGEGSQPRHAVSFQLTMAMRGMGATLNGQWQEAVRMKGAGSTDGIRYSPLSQWDIDWFVEPARFWSRGPGESFLSNLRFSARVRNVLDSYRHARLADGSIPAGYAKNEIDPLGRTVEFTISKRF